MVNFEDGQLINGAYVTIDGVNYPVHMPEYLGNTPLSSENLNKLQTDLKQQIENFEGLQEQNGYCRLQNGLLIQWGKKHTEDFGGISGNYNSTFDFPTQFNSVYTIVTSMEYPSGIDTTGAYIVSTSQYKLWSRVKLSGFYVDWIAIGI